MYSVFLHKIIHNAKSKGREESFLICGINLNTPLKTCTSFSVRFQLIPIRIKLEKVFSTQLWHVNCKLIKMLLLLTVALGSIPELPAASCEEIKMSEGQVVASKKYWMICISQDMAVRAYCNMTTGGELNCWRAFASQHTILPDSGKMPKFSLKKLPSILFSHITDNVKSVETKCSLSSR